MELDKRIVKAIEDEQGWNILSTNEQDGLYYTEIEKWSPAGENIVETIWHDGTPQSFANSLCTNYEDFDPDEHAAMWYNAEDRGQPKSMRVLLKDADEIESMLEELMIAVKNAIVER